MTQKEIIETVKMILLDFIHLERTRQYFNIGGINELIMVWLDDWVPIMKDINDLEVVSHLYTFTDFLKENINDLINKNDDELLDSNIWLAVRSLAERTFDFLVNKTQ